MIHYVKGDLIKAFERGEVTMIAHGCNCHKCMGGGIAYALAKVFPVIRESDTRLRYTPEERLGRVVKIKVAPNKYILNCYTQLGYGEGLQLNYKALKRCMQAIWQHIKTNPYMQDVVFGIPKIGAGLAGGNWKRIERIINKAIKGNVFVYELEEQV